MEEGIAQQRQGLAAYRATGAEIGLTGLLTMLAGVHGQVGQVEEGLILLAEALAFVDKTGGVGDEAELYWLKGQLTLQSKVESGKLKEAEAETCFLKAIDIARQQSAKSLELRAVMSLARLWQQQGKQHEARTMLSEIYNWFTEGFEDEGFARGEGTARRIELNHFFPLSDSADRILQKQEDPESG